MIDYVLVGSNAGRAGSLRYHAFMNEDTRSHS